MCHGAGEEFEGGFIWQMWFCWRSPGLVRQGPLDVTEGRGGSQGEEGPGGGEGKQHWVSGERCGHGCSGQKRGRWVMGGHMRAQVT